MVKQRRRIRNGAQRLSRETYVLQRRLLSDRVGRLSVRKLEEDRSCLVGASCEFRLGARSSESQRCPPSRAIRKVDGDRRSRSLQFAHFRGEGNQPSLSGLTSLPDHCERNDCCCYRKNRADQGGVDEPVQERRLVGARVGEDEAQE